MTYRWKKADAEVRIEKRLKDVETVTIRDYKRDMSLENIQTNEGYRVKGAHLYADIINLDDMLHCTDTEGVSCHRRTLRFLNQHFRTVHQILARVDAIKVDFHNQRLHAVVARPYDTETGAEASRVHRAVATAQLIIDVLKETGSEDEHIDAAKMRVGIDTGTALAVNNGRGGYREPLFLGKPANHAAKRAGGGRGLGIFLTNDARTEIGLNTVDNENTKALTKAEIEVSQKAAALEVTKDEMVQWWRDDMDTHPFSEFEFFRQTPPFRDMKIEDLTPANSRRQEAISLYGDIDGFTAYVDRHIGDDERAKDVVRTLHVLRAEMDAVLASDFGGKKIRFIGDCIHGLMAEGTAQTPDVEATISNAVLCAGGLRSSFELSLEKLANKEIDTDGLGIGIGLEYGVITVTRLGMRGARIRCAVSRSIVESEARQKICEGDDTAIGQHAYDQGTAAIRTLFGKHRKKVGLDYDTVVQELVDGGDETAKKARQAVHATVYVPAAVKTMEHTVRPHCAPIRS